MRKPVSEHRGMVVVGVLVAVANIWHILVQWSTNPPDRYFTGIAHYYADYFLYVSQMAQGARGSWIMAANKFTDEPLSHTWIYWFNVIAGHIGALAGLTPFITYGMLLILLSGILLFLWAQIARRVFPGQSYAQMIAFVFLATASNVPDIPFFWRHGTFALLSDFWFSPAPALNRLGGVPHQMLQTILILLVCILFTDRMEILFHTKTNGSPFRISVMRRIALFTVISFLAATANPIQMVLVVPTLLVVIGVWSLFERRIYMESVVWSAALIISALIGAILTNREFAGQPILTMAKVW